MSRYIPHESRYFWKQDRWNGGQSNDSRVGSEGANRFSIGLDTRFDSSFFRLAKRSVNVFTPNKLIKWIEVNPKTNDVYYYGQDTIYQSVGGSGLLTPVRIIGTDSPNGQGMQHFFNKLYYRSATQLGRFDYATTWQDNYQTGLAASASFTPMCRLLNMLLIANGRYIDTIDDIDTYTSQRITLPADYTVRDIFPAGKGVCILAMYGTAVTDSDEGMIFFWNGSSTTYDNWFPLTGNPHAGLSNGDDIIIISGTQPTINLSRGGMPKPLHRLPNVLDGDTAEVYPGAIDNWQNMIHFGISDGTSNTIQRAVWNYGARDTEFSSVLNAEFPISFGNDTTLTNYLGTSIQITALKRIGTTIHFAWKKGASYGIDKINTSLYQSQGILRTLAFDRQGSPFVKVAAKAMAELSGGLNMNESVRLKISPDPYNDPSFTNSSVSDTNAYRDTTYNALGGKLVELPLVVGQEVASRDLHMEVTLQGNGATTPQVKRIWAEVIEPNDML